MDRGAKIYNEPAFSRRSVVYFRVAYTFPLRLMLMAAWCCFTISV